MINNWIEKTIIGLDLCPFTRKPYFEGKVSVQELQGSENTEAQDQFLTALNSFQAQNKFETALLVYPHWKVSFKDFYDFSQDCEMHLETLGLESEFQLVAFHPDFCFEGLDFSDRANLVNSSPLPLIHILRVSDLDIVGLTPKEAELMSLGNARKLEALSISEITNHFPWRI